MRTIKLLLEYDGTDYVGWQVQPNGVSVQGVLEKALATVLREQISTVAAGRTDAGVHARGQVVSFRTAADPELATLQKSLNGILPEDIAVVRCEGVPDDFHARYSAKGRLYRYHLALAPTAINRRYSWYVGGYVLDVSLLNEIAGQVIGEHDFASFCKSDSGLETFLCNVTVSTWAAEGSKLIYTIGANRFLYGMVRALVGTMVEIARGYRQPDEFAGILRAKDRTRAGMSAPARGLFLEAVTY